MAVVKFDILPQLKKSIHVKWFGANKTWRGFVLMPVLTVVGLWLEQIQEPYLDVQILRNHPTLLLGSLLGFSYALFELPNSFLKRKVGIKPGQMSDKNPWLFSVLDQADSVVGCLLVYLCFVPLNISIILGIVLGGTLIHLLFNLLLYSVGLRKNPL
jgi:CDP-diacylglycerol--serine O-phosphatidyltransferase